MKDKSRKQALLVGIVVVLMPMGLMMGRSGFNQQVTTQNPNEEVEA